MEPFKNMAQSHRLPWSMCDERDTLILNFDSNRQTTSSIKPILESDHLMLPKRLRNCGWCGKSEIGERNFCSDACFAQCQRAAFQRAKVCDWCRHVRHSVPYVDLIDGKRQLHFCTEKCRNQYKMAVFCAETSSMGFKSCKTLPTSDSVSQNILVNRGATNTKSSKGAILITPDLWFVDSQLNQLATESDYNTAESASMVTEVNEPLNLVLNLPSSPQNTNATKRKSTNTEINKKKGKSHRKTQPRFDENLQTLTRPGLSSPASLPLTSSYPDEWRGFSSQLAHQSLINLQSQLMSNINGLMKPLTNDAVHEEIASDVSISEENNGPEINVDGKCPKSYVNNCVQTLLHEQNTEKECNIIPPNMVILRVPCLVPILIPVPIPIPLNIHEKYLNELLK